MFWFLAVLLFILHLADIFVTYCALRKKRVIEHNPLYPIFGEYLSYIVTILITLGVIYLWYLARQYWFVNCIAVICIIIKLYIVIHNIYVYLS